MYPMYVYDVCDMCYLRRQCYYIIIIVIKEHKSSDSCLFVCVCVKVDDMPFWIFIKTESCRDQNRLLIQNLTL